jgi:hypothetical protein
MAPPLFLERKRQRQRSLRQHLPLADVFVACVRCCLQEEARAKVEEQKKRAEEARAAAAEAARRKQVRRTMAQRHVAAQQQCSDDRVQCACGEAA